METERGSRAVRERGHLLAYNFLFLSLSIHWEGNGDMYLFMVSPSIYLYKTTTIEQQQVDVYN